MTRRALLIGSGIFDENSGLASLPGPEHDIAELSRVLGTSGAGGFQVTVLSDRPASEIRSHIGDMLEEARHDDLIFIHYSGHGRRGKRQGLFLAARDSQNNRPSTMISIGDIRNLTEESLCQRIVLSLDCCFSGAAVDAWTRADEQQTHEELEKAARPGFFILASSSRVATSEERYIGERGIRMGAMTSVMVEGIRSGAAAAPDGTISLANLVDYLSTNLGRQKPEFFSKGNASQIILARIGTSRSGIRKRVQDWRKSGKLSPPQARALTDMYKMTEAGFQPAGVCEIISYLEWPGANPETTVALLERHSPKSPPIPVPGRRATRKRREPGQHERKRFIEKAFVIVSNHFERRISQSGYEGHVKHQAPGHLHAFMPGGGDSLILSCLWLGEAGGLHWEQPSICFKCGLCIPKDRIVIEQGNKPIAITWPSIEYASVETDPGSSRLHLELTIGRLPAERLTAAALARRLWSRFLDPEVIKQGLQEAKQREEIREKIRRQNIWGDKGTNPTDETK